MQRFKLHPKNPSARAINQVINCIKANGVGAIPTDSGYALVCALDNTGGKKRIETIRQLAKNHLFSLLCYDLINVSKYVQLSNSNFRLLKQNTPGQFTFILPASREVPRRLMQRKTIGIRIPENTVALAILEQWGEPLISSSLKLPNDDIVLNVADDIQAKLATQLDFLAECDPPTIFETTVVDCCQTPLAITRQGSGTIV